MAFSPEPGWRSGYVWRRADFPWLGIWEENLSRVHAPGTQTLTRGMEFGVSPFPETRTAMIERGRLFDTLGSDGFQPRAQVSVEYFCVSAVTDAIPETLEWPAN